MNRYLQRALSALESELSDVPPERLLARPIAGKWSAAEIVEHLALTLAATSKALERCLQTGRPMVSPGGWRQRLVATVTMGVGRLPSGRPAPSFARPRGAAPDAAVQAYRHQLQALERVLDRCDERFGPHRPLLNHPALGAFSADQWRKYHWIHTRHHLEQIRRRTRAGGDQTSFQP